MVWHNLLLHAVPLNNMMIKGSSNSPQRQDSVTIECNVTANPPANIMWMKRISQGMQILTNTVRISTTQQVTNTPNGPTSSSILTISNVEGADNGDYICEASNGPLSPSLSAIYTICVIGKVAQLSQLTFSSLSLHCNLRAIE